MNIWQFMSDSPWLTFFIVVVICTFVEETICHLTKKCKRCGRDKE